MDDSKTRAFAACIAACGLCGCVAFNDECARVMEAPEENTGFLGESVLLTRDSVRQEDNAIGQLVADAYYDAFGDKAKKPALAIVNGGSIRSDGMCEVRDFLPAGPVQRKVLRDILPYDNSVVLVEVSHKELKDIFEYAVKYYSNVPGAYLQVSNARVDVDCGKVGDRVRAIALRDRDCEASEEDDCYKALALDPPSESEKVYLAVDSYLANPEEPGDGFDMFKGKAHIYTSNSYNFEIVASYFLKTHPESAPLRLESGRVNLTNCK